MLSSPKPGGQCSCPGADPEQGSHRAVPCRAVPRSHLPLQRKQSRTWSTKALPAPAMAWAAAAVRAWHSLGGKERGQPHACPGCRVLGDQPRGGRELWEGRVRTLPGWG